MKRSFKIIDICLYPQQDKGDSVKIHGNFERIFTQFRIVSKVKNPVVAIVRNAYFIFVSMTHRFLGFLVIIFLQGTICFSQPDQINLKEHQLFFINSLDTSFFNHLEELVMTPPHTYQAEIAYPSNSPEVEQMLLKLIHQPNFVFDERTEGNVDTTFQKKYTFRIATPECKRLEKELDKTFGQPLYKRVSRQDHKAKFDKLKAECITMIQLIRLKLMSYQQSATAANREDYEKLIQRNYREIEKRKQKVIEVAELQSVMKVSFVYSLRTGQ